MNHSFASSQRVLTESLLDEALREINSRRLKGLFTVTRVSEGCWEVAHEGGYPFNLSVWLATKRKVEFRKGSIDYFCFWVESVLQNEIAAKFGGRCSDESADETWSPEPNRWLSFEAYFQDTHKHIPRAIRWVFWSSAKKHLPKSLQPLATGCTK